MDLRWWNGAALSANIVKKVDALKMRVYYLVIS